MSKERQNKILSKLTGSKDTFSVSGLVDSATPKEKKAVYRSLKSLIKSGHVVVKGIGNQKPIRAVPVSFNHDFLSAIV